MDLQSNMFGLITSMGTANAGLTVLGKTFRVNPSCTCINTTKSTLFVLKVWKKTWGPFFLRLIL